MKERERFIEDWLAGRVPVAELCRLYGVSRKSGYKWINRYRTHGLKGLEERSRAPHRSPQRVSLEVEAAILDARAKHPNWGPKKLVVWLALRRPDLSLPAPSTIGVILHAYGLVKRRTKRHRLPPRTAPFGDCSRPNATWCADFKGEFTVGNRTTCYPLTMSDAYSRFLLTCEGHTAIRFTKVRAAYERTFRKFGLPDRIRTDSGTPFGSPAPGGLSRLSVWLLKLGVHPERISPGKPQENGRHERLHLTLKQETALPPRSTLSAQQRAFDEFRREYNGERPHEALGQVPPASVYAPSTRPFPRKIPPMTYPTSYAVRSVRPGGEIQWRNDRTYVSKVLSGERVGLEEIGDGLWSVHFGPADLGLLDYRGCFYPNQVVFN